ncbi:MAG: hypothetical protein ACXWKH_00515 [Limisphaerales bacterium]
MRHILHILTKEDDALARKLIEEQKSGAHQQIDVVDLTRANPNYDELVKKIFDANSVEVW